MAAALAVCAAFACTAATASATDGHLAGFSFMDKRTSISRLPQPIRFSFGDIPGVKKRVRFGPKLRGPVWFGKVERPMATIYAAGNSRWVCEIEESDRERGGGGGTCTTLASARELGVLHVSSCGKGAPRHFRIAALVPNGATGLAIVGSDGLVGRTVPVIDNTVAFTVGRENIRLRGVGDVAAEELERNLPLATVAKQPPPGGPGCSSFSFFETSR